jgi:NTE family protein
MNASLHADDLRLHDRGADPALLQTTGRNYRFVAMASDISHGRLVRLPWDYEGRFHVDPDETPVAEAVALGNTAGLR